MSNTVIIPTVGTGSRMEGLTKDLNKALLPYKQKPVLAHIIENFPNDTRFIIPLGYKSEQIIDFCKVTYYDRNITFVQVNDWTSERSGTAYTLKACEEYITGPFWYVPCDTYFNENVFDNLDPVNYYFIKKVPEKKSNLYTMFQISDSKIKDISFKETRGEGWEAFVGLMFIYDNERFFSKLRKLDNREFIYIIEPESDTRSLDSWLDFGNIETYQTEVSKSQKFDFSKNDEITYICNNRVIKWWLDPTIAEKKYSRILNNKTVFPDNCFYSNNWLSYDYFPGNTLYQHNDPAAFSALLEWLETEVWIINDENIVEHSFKFYKEKTLSRINSFLTKYPDLKSIKYVDDVAVKDYDFYLNRIDWDLLTQENLSGFFHGDLQFDNVVISNGKFKLIDWRHEFSTSVTSGDIYYDIAKLAGGLIINYSKIKEHNFDIEIINDSVILKIPNVDHIDQYQKTLKEYIDQKQLNYKKIQLLIPIIFWNMAPLHTAPFDLFLWYLGIKLFEELHIDEKIHQSK
jgi:NDP-sugar pyrophosphorylase family protein